MEQSDKCTVRTGCGGGETDTEMFEWTAETGLIGTETPSKTYISALAVRMSLEPVSYTHLDVYKRQSLQSERRRGKSKHGVKSKRGDKPKREDKPKHLSLIHIWKIQSEKVYEILLILYFAAYLYFVISHDSFISCL